mgnify:CR=1 FL=1
MPPKKKESAKAATAGTAEDFEKLGVFYLGRPYDLAAKQAKPGWLLYDSKDLVTHAVCVGMTGSGKTGLCLALLEEAAIDNIPAIIIDPKGDLTNLLLTFPELRPEDFQPWVHEDEARRAGKDVATFAAEQVTRALVGRTVADVERDLILETLKHCLGNRTHAANILGISIRTLRNKLNEYAADGVPVRVVSIPCVERFDAQSDAAKAALAKINVKLGVMQVLDLGLDGLSVAAIYFLAAIGLAITFGVMGVINMAHGEMVMIGAYTTFVVQEVIRTSYPGLFDYSLLIAAPLAFVVAGIIGILIEQGIIRFLYGRPLETLLATWGLSLVLQQAVRTAFGPTNREVGNPSWMSGAFEIGQISITYGRLWIVVFTMAVFVGLLALLRFTRLGLEMRAVTQNRSMAASMGIRTSRVDALTFGLGSGIAGIAGVALSQIDNVSPNLGQGYIIDSFMVVVFGGVGNLFGTLLGATALGIVNKFLEPYAGAVLGKILVLVFIILFIQRRPRGLFAQKGRAVE